GQGGVPTGPVVLVVGEAPVGTGMDHFSRKADGHLPADVLVNVQAQRLLVAERVVHQAAVVFDQARGEVASGLGSTTHAGRGLVGNRRVAEQEVLVVVERAVRSVEVGQSAGADVGDNLGSVPDPRAELRARIDVGRTDSLGDGELRGADAATLGGNENYAVRRLGTVDRGSR